MLEKAVSPAGKDAVKVTLPTSFTNKDNHCNVAYVVRKIDTKDILWSWHLWITDYDPYPDNLILSTSIFQYQVEGGELHRYNNAIFKTGIYSNKLIMDRNIGARSADFEGHGSITNNDATYPGTLYYQFGRKDPFPRINSTYLNGYTYELDDDDRNTKQNFEYAVSNPHTFVTNTYNWCSNESAKYDIYIWNDYKVKSAAYTTGKSIFDPSPLGFRLPLIDTWSGFTGNRESYEAKYYYTFPWTRYFDPIPDEYNYGRLYYSFAYYPASGCISNYYGNLNSGGRYWSAIPSNDRFTYCLNFHSSDVNISSFSRAYGFPIRPVQE